MSAGFQEELFEAIRSGDVDAVRRCVKCGAPVNDCDRNGFTPLQFAAMREDARILEVLLEAGANPDPNNRDTTALQIAARAGSLEMIHVLAAGGADLLARVSMENDLTEPTPEEIARRAGHHRVAEEIHRLAISKQSKALDR